MIGIDALMVQMPGLRKSDLERWIGQDWIRLGPDGPFVEIDVARVRLIRNLRDELQIDEDALDVVLLLLDQLHDVHRRMRQLGKAIEHTVPEPLRRRMVIHLERTADE
jgi:chaperone modulatory protein CbpM